MCDAGPAEEECRGWPTGRARGGGRCLQELGLLRLEPIAGVPTVCLHNEELGGDEIALFTGHSRVTFVFAARAGLEEKLRVAHKIRQVAEPTRPRRCRQRRPRCSLSWSGTPDKRHRPTPRAKDEHPVRLWSAHTRRCDADAGSTLGRRRVGVRRRPSKAPVTRDQARASSHSHFSPSFRGGRVVSVLPRSGAGGEQHDAGVEGLAEFGHRGNAFLDDSTPSPAAEFGQEEGSSAVGKADSGRCRAGR